MMNDIIHKRIMGMAVRILSNLETYIGYKLDDVSDSSQFKIDGGKLKILRNEILNSAGDTIRSINSSLSDDRYTRNKISISKNILDLLANARFFIKNDDPRIEILGDIDLLNKIRDLINAGIVYNDTYICAGIDDNIRFLIPFLDKIVLSGTKVGGGNYRSWRDEVVGLYIKG